MIKILGFLLITISFSAQALQATEFKDQFGELHQVDLVNTTVLYASDKKAGDKAVAFFSANKEALEGITYIANISRMPSFISDWIAIPAMKDYGFPVLLQREGELYSEHTLEKGDLLKVEYKNGQAIRTTIVPSAQPLSEALK